MSAPGPCLQVPEGHPQTFSVTTDSASASGEEENESQEPSPEPHLQLPDGRSRKLHAHDGDEAGVDLNPEYDPDGYKTDWTKAGSWGGFCTEPSSDVSMEDAER
uniref:Uncharacterized protein n=1 Tax=Pyrodinium bahamense TaxID=73915 RepID=A0A7S0FF41_9DINO